MDWNVPIDIDIGTAYGVYSDTGGIYEVDFSIWEDFEYQRDCREYSLFGEERCDEFEYLSWAEVWLFAYDGSKETAVVARMRAYYDRTRDVIVAQFDDEMWEFSPRDDIWKAWTEYRKKKVEPLLKLEEAIKYFKEHSCCNEGLNLYTDKKEAERASWAHKLFLAQLHMAAKELGEEPDDLMYQLGLL